MGMILFICCVYCSGIYTDVGKIPPKFRYTSKNLTICKICLRSLQNVLNHKTVSEHKNRRKRRKKTLMFLWVINIYDPEIIEH